MKWFIALFLFSSLAFCGDKFICQGYLKNSQFNEDVPPHFRNITLDFDNLNISVFIDDGKTSYSESFIAKTFAGTAYHKGSLFEREDGGFNYLTFEEPGANFKALYVHAEGHLSNPNRVRARFSMVCSAQ